MKGLISLIALIVALIFIGCGGVDSDSSGDNVNLTKVKRETSITNDKFGRVTNDGNANYKYDENGNLVAINK